MKKVIMAAVAAAFVSGTAQAAIITNGGNPEYSLTEIQANVDNGKWPRYPYVAGTGVTAYNTLFANTFEDGRVLPQFHDVVALQRAVKESNVVLVADASEGLILPCPSVFVELGRQNGVSCYRFMEHYVTSTTDVDSDAFGEHARAQTEVIINIIESLTADQISMYEMLIAAGLDRERALQAQVMTLMTQVDNLNAKLVDDNDMTWENVQAAYNAGRKAGVMSVIIPEERPADQYTFTVTNNNGVEETHTVGSNSDIQAVFNAGRADGLATLAQALEDNAAAAIRIAELNDDVRDLQRANSNLAAAVRSMEQSRAAGMSFSIQAVIDAAQLVVDRTRGFVTFDQALSAQINNRGLDRFNPATPDQTSTFEYNGNDIVFNNGENEINLTLFGRTRDDITDAIDDGYISNEIISAIYDSGFESGYEQGYVQGYEDGFRDGAESVN